MKKSASFTLPCLLLCVSACGSRTGPATQSVAAAFDPKGSDEKAIAVADEVITALGGEAAWNKAHEIIWVQGLVQDGKLVDGFKHSWDRWGGRHQFIRLDSAGTVQQVMHDLYDKTGTAQLNGAPVMKQDAQKMIDDATKRFNADAFLFVFPFKLKDPGVHLALVQEGCTEGSPKQDILKMTYDPGVGPASGDTYFVRINKESHIPEALEFLPSGKDIKTDCAGYGLSNWVDAGGLKFAGTRTTLGYTKDDAPKVAMKIPDAWKDLGIPQMDVPNPGELMLITGIKVNADSNDDLYVPQVK